MRPRCRVDLFPRQVSKRPDFRSNENVQLGWKQIGNVRNALLNFRHLRLVLLKRVAIDDREIDPSEIQEIVYVFRWPARDDRQDLHVAA